MSIAPPDAAAAVRAAAARRGAGKTVCPSEIARALAGDQGDWRALMPAVHRAVDGLVAEGAIALSWKGVALTRRDGPYRIRLTP